jgi:tRNA-specific 2-thiouridylase
VPAFLHVAKDAAWVELAADEDGVSPGQACVFYASSDPQARVLGGGFITATQLTAGNSSASRADDPALASAGR